MKNIAMTALLVSTLIIPALSYTALDNYYGDGLYPQDSTRTVSQKINFPGYYADTTSSSSIALGYLKQSSPYYSSSDLNLSDFNGWTEMQTEIGTIGCYLGNVSFSNNKETSLTTSDSTDATGLGALWFVPKTKTRLKGISIEVAGLYSVGNQFSSNEPNYPSNYSYYNNATINQSASKNISLTLMTLIKLTEELDLKADILGQYNKRSDNTSINYSYAYSYYPYSSYSENYSKSSTYTGKNGSMSLGIVNKQGRYLGLTIGGDMDLNQYSSNYYYLYGASQNNNFYSLWENIEYSERKVFNYLGHSLLLGINVFAGLNQSCDNTSEPLELSKVFSIHKPSQTYYASVSCPIMLKMHIFSVPVYALAKIYPSVYTNYYKNASTNFSSRTTSFYISQIALGLQGKIGDKLEFAIIPSLQDKLFVTGIELNYKLGNNKPQK
jgi:hypothetical protein